MIEQQCCFIRSRKDSKADHNVKRILSRKREKDTKGQREKEENRKRKKELRTEEKRAKRDCLFAIPSQAHLDCFGRASRKGVQIGVIRRRCKDSEHLDKVLQRLVILAQRQIIIRGL